MLKVNVGLSRKVSRDFNSTGFSLNLEGEVGAALDDPEMVIEKIKEFYDLAEESLNQQVERYESESAISSRDEVSPRRVDRPASNQSNSKPQTRQKVDSQNRSSNTRSFNRHEDSFVPATNKQVQFLLNLGKKKGFSKPKLETHLASLLGYQVDLYELSKEEAGKVLQEMTADKKEFSSRR